VKKLLCTFLFMAVAAFGQNPPNLESGLHPYGSYHGGDLDTVSLASGNLTLHIPIISYPERGGKLDVNYFLVLNSKGWITQWHVTNQTTNTGYYSWNIRPLSSGPKGGGTTGMQSRLGGYSNVSMTNNHYLGLQQTI